MNYIKRNRNNWRSLYSKVTKSNKHSLHKKDWIFNLLNRVSIRRILQVIGKLEGEEPEEEKDGLVLVKYMKHSGGRVKNSFIWPSMSDMLQTNVYDIVCNVDPPTPISNRAHGVNLKDMKIVNKKLLKWLTFLYF